MYGSLCPPPAQLIVGAIPVAEYTLPLFGLFLFDSTKFPSCFNFIIMQLQYSYIVCLRFEGA